MILPGIRNCHSRQTANSRGNVDFSILRRSQRPPSVCDSSIGRRLDKPLQIVLSLQLAIAGAHLDRMARERRRQSEDRVAPGRCRPGAPTDPYVRDWRIRFLESQFRCAAVNRMNSAHGHQRIALEKMSEHFPRHLALAVAAIEPLLPAPPDCMVEAS